ncbi:MAG: Cof-type HAD-IIB family hydrolase [bacterium]|nr:Cof-type HAD-IIB family hydrolase [bacterium]
MPYRLLALDVDGTILDPNGVLRPAVQQAIAAVRKRGIRVILCTGRRFRSALPVAQELELEAPLVVHNGALVKDPTSTETLHQTVVSSTVYQLAIEHLRPLSVPMLYVDAFNENVDILTEDIQRAHPFQQAYLNDNLPHCRIVPDINTPPPYGVVMIGIMAEAVSLQPLQSQLAARLDGQAHVHLLINKNYQGHILQVLPPNVSKWKALRQLAHQEGVAEASIVAIGDDENDMEMIQQAGLGIAMGNAQAKVKAVADYVTGSNAEDGLVQAIERFFL